MLPPRLPKKKKRETRWRSQAHCNFVRSHACCACGSTSGIEVAHVRLGSGAGMGQKPDDWRTVSLCGDCHRKQHEQGEATFWGSKFEDRTVWTEYGPGYRMIDVEKLINAFCNASPKAREITADRFSKGLL